MNFRSVMAIMTVTVLMAGTSRADFKYTQQSKVTGGTLASVSKSLSVFSKNARQATAPQTTTTMIHGNRLRTEGTTGTVQIIDLDGRRFINIDNAKRTYTIQTFEQLKQQIAREQAKAKEEQAKASAKHDDPQTMTMVPKFDIQATGATHPVLDIPAKEMKMRVDLLFKSSDPKTEADLEKSKMSTWMTSDSWYGTVPGYEELRSFYVKMAKELNWLPGSIGMGAANPQMGQAMDEFKKNAIKMDGMPLLQYTSFGLAGMAQETQPDQAAQQPPPASNDNSVPTSASGAIAKGLGGLFAKKKHQQADENAKADAPNPNNPPPPTPVAGSMMDMTIEVTSYSKDSVDASLFDVPAGYAQVQPADANPK
jgi:hypothetical protein